MAAIRNHPHSIWLKDLQGRVLLWTNADAHARRKMKSGLIQSWQQRHRSAPRLSNGGGSGGGGFRRLDNHARGEIGGFDGEPSSLGQIGGILEAALNDSRQDSTGSWPKFGLSAPDA